ncbi:MAG: TfoX/Sxy family protein [Pseudorhodobacter sp.]|nr:TfoX/Sxy family protein [Pseudorhodobacter sp.]
MTTKPATVAHIIDTMPNLNLTAKRMFGEYGLYLDGIVVAFICDDTLFIKPTPAALALLPEAEMGAAYPGSKNYIVACEILDDPDLCARALRAVAADAPPPKPKKPKALKPK